MDVETLRKHCLKFPHTTEKVQWGAALCFKVDGKLFAVTRLEPGPVRLSFKCSPENFAELCERSGVQPAPYMARAQWVGLEELNTIPDGELRELIAEAYRLVFDRFSKRRQQELQASAAGENSREVRKATGKKAAKKSTSRKNARKRVPTKAKTKRSDKAFNKSTGKKAGRRG